MLAPLDSFESEMAEWSTIIDKGLVSDAPVSILDLGTGGGHHLYHLLQNLPKGSTAVGVDLSGEMLEQAKGLISGLSCLEQNMTEVHLNETFSLVTVHDSFCYLNTSDDVSALFRTIAEHLSPEGLSLVKLDAVEDDFEGPYRYLTTFEEDDYEITLTHYEWDPIKHDGILEVIYLFMERSGESLSTREERHRLGLFSKSHLGELAAACGLRFEFVELERWDDERANWLLKLCHQQVI